MREREREREGERVARSLWIKTIRIKIERS